MKIGIPNALFIRDKIIMYSKFLNYNNIDTVISSDTSLKTIEDGVELATSEDCIASKIFLGHVNELVNLYRNNYLDAILVPRVYKQKNNIEGCVKALALYDILNNIFRDVKFIDVNVDYSKNITYFKSLINLGITLGINSKNRFLGAFYALPEQNKFEKNRYMKQFENINFKKKNVLVIGNEYIVNDKYIKRLVISSLNNVNIIFACINNKVNRYKNISDQVYFANSINIMNGVEEYIDFADACIFITGFPCATDSLVNEMIKERINGIPYIEIMVDENTSSTGIVTRMESFSDIIEGRRYI